MLDSLSVSCFNPVKCINPRYRKDAEDTSWRKKGPMMYKDFYLEVPCGKCYLCRKRLANNWRVRLFEECLSTPQMYYEGKLVYNAFFITFTYENASLPPNKREDFANHIKHWRDNWRKKYGKSPRYFITTDKGSQFERLHLHAIIFNPYDYKNDCRIDWNACRLHNFHWKYGFVFIDFEKPYLESAKGVSYVTGYITGSNLGKDAQKHGKPISPESMYYRPYVFVSNGLGAKYVYGMDARLKGLDNMLYSLNGFNYSLPQYYKNKLFNKEQLFCMSQIYQLEREQYIVHRAKLGKESEYSVAGSLVTFEGVGDLYDKVYRYYDKIPNTKFYAKE